MEPLSATEPDADRSSLHEALETALSELRALDGALSAIAVQFRDDRARTDAAINAAELAVSELRREMQMAITSLRNDVAATVQYIEAAVAERIARMAADDLLARVVALERALNRDGP